MVRSILTAFMFLVCIHLYSRSFLSMRYTGSRKTSCRNWWRGAFFLLEAFFFFSFFLIPAILWFYAFTQDTVTGFLLAGVGHRTAKGSNFLVVKPDTKLQSIEEAFAQFSTREDVGIVLINQHIANNIRHVLKDYHSTIPTVLEIPSKEHPYDPEQDYIMQRVVSLRMIWMKSSQVKRVHLIFTYSSLTCFSY